MRPGRIKLTFIAGRLDSSQIDQFLEDLGLKIIPPREGLIRYVQVAPWQVGSYVDTLTERADLIEKAEIVPASAIVGVGV